MATLLEIRRPGPYTRRSIVRRPDPNIYSGTFKTGFGDEWVFIFDYRTWKAELRGGDVGWDTVHEVHEGMVHGLILSAEELAWLRLCWQAATECAPPPRDHNSPPRI